MTDEQIEIAQLTEELQVQTARANALDVRASAAERVARAAAAAQETGQVLTHRGSELTNAIELWQRTEHQGHPGRARDYGDAIVQLAQATEWVPELDGDTRREVRRHAAKWGQTIGEWLGDTVHQYLAEYGDQ